MVSALLTCFGICFCIGCWLGVAVSGMFATRRAFRAGLTSSSADL